MSQSAPRKLITPIGDKTLEPFGFDGPHDYETIKNGITHLEKSGSRATIWVDTEYIHDKNYQEFLRSKILNDSWELGIHYSKSLKTLVPPEDYTLIAEEFENIFSLMNMSPKSWCSSNNEDTVDQANFINSRYAIIWRNGETGVHAIPKVGNLEDGTWEWWSKSFPLRNDIPGIYPSD